MNALRNSFSLVPRCSQAQQACINTYAREADKIFDRVRKVRETADTYEPSKLLVVTMLSQLKGRPYWEKNICTLLGLVTTKQELAVNIRKQLGHYIVVPNTPHICKLLWRIKHLVAVKPVTFPDGLPTPGDFTGTHLNRFGVFRIDNKLKVDPERLQVDPKYEKLKLEGKEIAKPMHLRWMNGL